MTKAKPNSASRATNSPRRARNREGNPAESQFRLRLQSETEAARGRRARSSRPSARSRGSRRSFASAKSSFQATTVRPRRPPPNDTLTNPKPDSRVVTAMSVKRRLPVPPPLPLTSAAGRKTEIGVVTSDKMNKTRRVEIETLVPHPKYGKLLRLRTVCHAHDETNQSCTWGDIGRDHGDPPALEAQAAGGSSGSSARALQQALAGEGERRRKPPA